MPIYSYKIQEALDDVLREINRLEGIAANLRKCLPKSSRGASETSEEKPDKQSASRTGYKKKNTHATKIADIVGHSDKKLKIRDVINAYPARGWTLAKNAYNQIYKIVTDRNDLFIYEDGYVLPKNQEQAPTEEVTP